MATVGRKMARGVADFWNSVTRTKAIPVDTIHTSELKRCLSVVDLTGLGVGSTLGAGVYILTGQVAKYQAGPAVVLSFLVAAAASFLAGMCYAEFAARVPRAGSAYVYSYVSVGEFLAFVIGWNMILETIIGASSVGKAWSEYMDSMFNDTMRRHIESHVGHFDSPALGEYPDILAFSLLLLISLLIATGVKMSSVINAVFTVVNLLVIVCIVAVGSFHADGHNWTDGRGFFPMGFNGVLSGAATCFYAFVGFDVIATSGEEAKNPSASIPTAIVLTLIICFVAYFGVSAVLTLMVPWYALADEAALPKAFAQKSVVGAEYVIAVGGLCGLTASMMGSIFPLPRVIYSMAQDGLIFRFLGTVYWRTNTPFLATMVAGLMAALLALLLDLNSLVQMMSIGTLMAYTLVAVSVLVLHYQRDNVGLSHADMHQEIGDAKRLNEEAATFSQKGATEHSGLLKIGDKSSQVRYVPSQETTVFKRIPPPPSEPDDDDDEDDEVPNTSDVQRLTTKANGAARGGTASRQDQQEKAVLDKMAEYLSEETQPPPGGSTYQRLDSNYSLNSITQLFQLGDDSSNEPTAVTRQVAVVAMSCMFLAWMFMCVILFYGQEYLLAAEWWTITISVLLGAIIVAGFIVMVRQPRNTTKLNFKVPFVPFLPTVSVMVNIYLMITLSGPTWIRFAVWMGLGFVMYFGYGIWNSTERRNDSREVILYDVSDKDSILIDGVYR